jgi:hypothetical protein
MELVAYKLPNGEYKTEWVEVKPKVKPKAKEPAEGEAKAEKPAALPAVAPSVAAVGDWGDAVAAMNRQHAIIENVGGKAVIASWEPSTTDPFKLVVVFQNKESFLLRYSNRFVPVEVHTVRGVTIVRAPLGQW